MTVHGFDTTPASIEWLARAVTEPKFEFHPYGISSEDGFCQFFLPSNEGYVSASLLPREGSKALPVEVEMRTLETICSELSLRQIDYMKMDIEGAEYQVIRTLEGLPKPLLPKQLGVEFHHFFSSYNRGDTLEAIASLNRLGYKIAWTSATTHEVLFVLHKSGV